MQIEEIRCIKRKVVQHHCERRDCFAFTQILRRVCFGKIYLPPPAPKGRIAATLYVAKHLRKIKIVAVLPVV
jgi:hypothetical protein